MRDWTLGIDFGTSFTTAAMLSGGRIDVVEVERRRYLPSVVALDDQGTLLTGIAAEQLARQRPERAERLPKRALVSGDSVLLGGTAVTCVDMVATVLRRMHAEAVARQQGQPPARVVLTYPAAWPPHEQALLVKAAQTGELGEVELVPEPIAAGAYYARDRSEEIPVGGHLAVYDLGGGTFDTAVIRRTATGFALAGAAGGDPQLGGEDLDEALLEIIEEQGRRRDPGPWDDLWNAADPAGRYRQATLRQDVAAAKEALSSTTTVYVTVPGYADPFMIGRPEFEAMVEDRLGHTADLLETTVREAGVDPDALAAVVLAGGASATPRVSDLLAERLGRLPLIDPDPKLVVARGALVAGPAEPSPAGARPAPPIVRYTPDRDLFAE